MAATTVLCKVFMILFVATLAGTVFAVWRDRRDYLTDRGSQFVAGVVRSILVPLALIAVVGLVFGVW